MNIFTQELTQGEAIFVDQPDLLRSIPVLLRRDLLLGLHLEGHKRTQTEVSRRTKKLYEMLNCPGACRKLKWSKNQSLQKQARGVTLEEF